MTVMTRKPVRVLFAILVLLSLTIAATLGWPAAARADINACPAQVAALDANQAEIAEHNSRRPPGGVGPPEVVGPFNTEADQLNSQKDALLESLHQCEAVIAESRHHPRIRSKSRDTDGWQPKSACDIGRPHCPEG